MNQTFSLRRFKQLNRWFWAANGRTYSLGLLALLAITLLVLGRILTYDGYDASVAGTNIPYFLMLSVSAVGLLGSHIVSVLHDQHSALLYLMLPASRTEKFMVSVVYLLLFIVGYSVSYGLIEGLTFQLANSRLPALGNQYKSAFLSTSADRWVGISTLTYILLLTAVASLLGSLYFRRGVLVKTILLFFCLFFGLVFLYGRIVGAFFPGLITRYEDFLFGDLYVSTSSESLGGAPRLTTTPLVSYMGPVFTLVALWITARIRFNEIER